MSEQHGVLPQASVETTTTPPSASHPSMLPSEQQNHAANVDSSVKPIPSDPPQKTSASSTITGKIEIPKLSAATTELLARVTGSLNGHTKRDDTIASWDAPGLPPGPGLNNTWNKNTQRVGDMKASSAFLELPPAPDAIAQSGTTAPASVQGSYNISTGFIDLAPKPTNQARTQLPPPSLLTTTGTTNTPPVQQGKASHRRQTASNGTKKTTKRRRRGGDDDSDVIRAGDSSSDESDFTPTATQTKSGRQVNRPSHYVPLPEPSPGSGRRNNGTLSNSTDNNIAGVTPPVTRKRKRAVRKGKETNVNCMHCQRGHSPLSNSIVFCDWCNKAWHQLCHDPCIDDEVVQVKEKEWLCKQCKPVPLSYAQPTVVRSNPDIQRKFVRIPVEIPPLEVGGKRFSVDERRGYLSRLSHASLVELLVTLSEKNSDIAMFPGNLKDQPSSNFAFLSSTTTAASAAPDSGNGRTAEALNTENGDITTKQQDPGTAAEQQSAANSSANGKRRRDEFSDDEESEYEIFEDHRLYPRAGNGFRLPLDTDNLDILREDPACPTFSYSLHGPARARIEANDAAPVWSA